jgi:hypothetical protein
MDNLPEPNVCEFASAPRPSFEDWQLIAKGAHMTSEFLNMPWLRQYIDHEVFGVWYWQNLCMRIGSVTGGVLTHEDYVMIQNGVELHAVNNIRTVPRMVFTQHVCCDKDCYYCTLYKNSLFMEFGFELSKFLGYDGVDTSVFDAYGAYGDDGVFDDYGDDGDDGDDYGAYGVYGDDGAYGDDGW